MSIGDPTLGGRQGLSDGLPAALATGTSIGAVGQSDAVTLSLLNILQDIGLTPEPKERLRIFRGTIRSMQTIRL